MGHGAANQSILFQPSKATLLLNLFITLTLEKLGKSFSPWSHLAKIPDILFVHVQHVLVMGGWVGNLLEVILCMHFIKEDLIDYFELVTFCTRIFRFFLLVI